MLELHRILRIECLSIGEKLQKKRIYQFGRRRINQRRDLNFFGLKIEKKGVKQGEAEHCERQLANLIVEKINNINHTKLDEEIHVGNWKLVDGKDYDSKFEPNTSLDEKIENYLKRLKNLKTKDGDFQIECYAIGYIGEYDRSQCNKSWKEVASIRFLRNNK